MINETMKNYTGNKYAQSVFKKIINHIPKFKVYGELFCGSGIVFRDLYNETDSFIINDLDSEVIKYFFENYNFQNIAIFNDNVFDLLQLLSTVFSGTKDNPELQPKITFLKAFLASVQIKTTVMDKDIFLFLDPPYLFETRSNNNLYNFELTNEQHLQLLQLVKILPFNIMIIHPVCDLYDTALSGWYTFDLKIRYHQKTSIERLYMNYPLPTELQTTKYLGNNCWERQRIKRKGDRLVKKINELPELEKQYILNKLKTIQ